MILQQKYLIGYHIMWYEREMVDETVQSLYDALQLVGNKNNVDVLLIINTQTLLETPIGGIDYRDIGDKFDRLPCHVEFLLVSDDDTFYNIAHGRRVINNYAAEGDYDVVLWGETDSLWPRQLFRCLEYIPQLSSGVTKYFATFAYRKNWDSSWDKLAHPMFKDVNYVDDETWTLTNEASEKSYMTLERMHEINDDATMEMVYLTGNDVKFDGSCVAISTDLIRSGVNIPMSVFHCGEDTAMMEMAKRIMGNQLVQFHFRDVLRVHNRRHPKKRVGIKGENNPNGFCDERKGSWWKILESSSKANLNSLFTQTKPIDIDDVIGQIIDSKNNEK